MRSFFFFGCWISCSQRGLSPHHSVRGVGSVHAVSALVLQLLQAAVVSAPHTADGDDVGALYRTLVARRASDGSAGGSVAADFVRLLLARCIGRADSRAGDSELRAQVEVVVEDWLRLVFHPSWPAAEPVLHLVAMSLLGVLRGDKTGPLRPMSLDLLGRIAAKLRVEAATARQLHQQQQHQQQLQQSMAAAGPADETQESVGQGSFPSDTEENARPCTCGRGWDDEFMIACDRCGWWLHGGCVGVDGDSPPSSFLCSECSARTESRARRAAAKVWRYFSPMRDADCCAVRTATQRMLVMGLYWTSWRARPSPSTTTRQPWPHDASLCTVAQQRAVGGAGCVLQGRVGTERRAATAAAGKGGTRRRTSVCLSICLFVFVEPGAGRMSNLRTMRRGGWPAHAPC